MTEAKTFTLLWPLLNFSNAHVITDTDRSEPKSGSSDTGDVHHGAGYGMGCGAWNGNGYANGSFYDTREHIGFGMGPNYGYGD